MINDGETREIVVVVKLKMEELSPGESESKESSAHLSDTWPNRPGSSLDDCLPTIELDLFLYFHGRA